MKNASYWVASHITGIFTIEDSYVDLLHTGSRGAGFSIKSGVTTTVKLAKKTTIQINGKSYFFNEAIVSTKVLELYNQTGINPPSVEISHEFKVLASSGFGTSAAGALGLSMSLNRIMGDVLTSLEVFQIAHKAEVLTHSGLGDIIGLFQGGAEIRLHPGAPGFGITKSMDFSDYDAYFLTYGPIPTQSIITNSDLKQKINHYGQSGLVQLNDNPTIETFGQVCYEFSTHLSLGSTKTMAILQTLIENDYLCGMIMLGDGVFVLRKKEEGIPIEIPGKNWQREQIAISTMKELEV